MNFRMQEKNNTVLSSLKRRRLPEEIADRLKATIYNGTYSPGDKLPKETELSEIFQVGRPVVREALRALENTGLIFVKPGAGGGAFVKKIGVETLADTLEGIMRLDKLSLEELIEARVTTEISLLPIIFKRITSEDINALEANVLEAQSDLEKGVEEPRNLKFHILLANACHNELLTKTTEALLDGMVDIILQHDYSYDRKKKVLEDHFRLLFLLKSKKYKEFEIALSEHIRGTLKLF